MGNHRGGQAEKIGVCKTGLCASMKSPSNWGEFLMNAYNDFFLKTCLTDMITLGFTWSKMIKAPLQGNVGGLCHPCVPNHVQ